MRMVRGSVSLLSSHGRGIGPQEALKKDYPIFLGLWQETLGSINLCRRSQGACQGASECFQVSRQVPVTGPHSAIQGSSLTLLGIGT